MKSLPMHLLVRAVFSLTLFILGATDSRAQEGPQESPPQASSDLHDFGQIGVEAPMEHVFQYRNEGTELLEVKNVQLEPPLTVTKMTARVQPGATGNVTVRLGQPRETGEFKGSVVVNFKNPDAAPRVFWVAGELVRAIEFEPFAAFFVTAQRGEEKTESIELINHTEQPLEILNVLSSSPRFTTKLETIEEGRRFRLSLALKPDAPAGRQTEVIELVTSSTEHPFLKVQANTSINERVYAFPPSIDFGAISTMNLKARTVSAHEFVMELMVYQTGGKDFQVSAHSDVPFLHLTPHQGSLKDRFGITVEVAPEKLKSGAVNGSITITTTDPEFPVITVPVKAIVEGSW